MNSDIRELAALVLGGDRAMALDAWEEAKHPRGNSKNAGQFAKGSGAKPAAKAKAVKKSAAPIPKPAGFAVQHMLGTFIWKMAAIPEKYQKPHELAWVKQEYSADEISKEINNQLESGEITGKEADALEKALTANKGPGKLAKSPKPVVVKPPKAEKPVKALQGKVPAGPIDVKKQLSKLEIHDPDFEAHADKEHKNLLQQHDKEAPPDKPQRKAIDGYVDGRYHEMNDCLRSGTDCDEAGDLIETLEETVRAVKLPKAMTLFRGTPLPSGIAAQLKPGAVYKDLGFLSTSTSLATAKSFSGSGGGGLTGRVKTMFSISAPKGIRARAIGANMGEGEVVFPPGQKFKVTAVERITAAKFTGLLVHVEAAK